MNFEVGDVLQNNITKEPCMIIKFYKFNIVKLLSWNMLDIWQEEIEYVCNNFAKFGHIDLSLLIGE